MPAARWSRKWRHPRSDRRDRRTPDSAQAAHAAGQGATSGSRSAASPAFPGRRARSRKHSSSKNSPTAGSSRPGPYFGGSQMKPWARQRRLRIGRCPCRGRLNAKRSLGRSGRCIAIWSASSRRNNRSSSNKSSVHFRADFEPIAEKAPDLRRARRDARRLPRPCRGRGLRPGIRLKPNGPAFVGRSPNRGFTLSRSTLPRPSDNRHAQHRPHRRLCRRN